MKKITSLVLFSFLFGFFGSVGSAPRAQAFEFFSDERVNVAKPSEDDIYILGDEVTVDQNVKGDVIVFGGDVTIFGDVEGDVIAVGGKISISGNVKDDVRLVGGELSVKGNVGDDIVAVGGKITLERGANVNGSVLAGGGYVTVDGNVHEHIKGQMEILRVRGWVDQDVEVATDTLIFSESAIVKGSLRYIAVDMALIPDGVVKGTVTQGGEILGVNYPMSWGFFPLFRLVEALFMFLTMVLLSFFLMYFVPEDVVVVAQQMREKFWRNIGIGVAAFIGIPLLMILFAVTIIGLPISLILGFGFTVALFLVQIPVGLFISDFIFKQKTASKWVLLGRFSVGYLILALLRIIPIFGPIFCFLLSLLALGSFLVQRLKMFQFLKSKKFW